MTIPDGEGILYGRAIPDFGVVFLRPGREIYLAGISSSQLFNVQRMNQNIEENYIMQKDPKLHWHNDDLLDQ